MEDVTAEDLSARELFARQLRNKRRTAKLTQEELAARLNIHRSMLSKIETGGRTAGKQLARRIDQEFDTGDLFSGLAGVVYNESVPAWFREWVEVEDEAEILRNYEVILVPGLLQTEDYARALFEGDEELVAARVARQRVLAKEDPPELHILLYEQVLHHQVGARQVMRDQLRRLVAAARERNITIQVIPFGKTTMGTGGAFMLASLPEANMVAYMARATKGSYHVKPAEVLDVQRLYEKLQAAALPQDESVVLISEIVEKKWV
jgi:transcriptional regulator with XRE-family HTH domain